MALASANCSTSLTELAQMEDKIMEVAVTSVSTFQTPSCPNPTEFEDLCSEIASLKSTLKNLSHHCSPSPQPCQQDPQDQLCYTSEMLPDSARNPALGGEKARPTTSGDEWIWPEYLLPILHN